MKSLVVDKKYDNKKIIPYLMNEFPNLSQNIIYKTLRKKDIRVNDKRISENILIHSGDIIQIYLTDNYLYGKNIKLDIIYEDDNILVINKPKNIEVTGKNSLTELVQKEFDSASFFPCHRLDRNTQGIVLFAKNNLALEIILTKFKNYEITKYYKCKVLGILSKKHEILNAYLFKDNRKSMVYISDEKKQGYRPIKTEYTVLEEDVKKNYSMLEVILHTGRTHQIRAHLAHIGHPIIGDRKIWCQ